MMPNIVWSWQEDEATPSPFTLYHTIYHKFKIGLISRACVTLAWWISESRGCLHPPPHRNLVKGAWDLKNDMLPWATEFCSLAVGSIIEMVAKGIGQSQNYMWRFLGVSKQTRCLLQHIITALVSFLTTRPGDRTVFTRPVNGKTRTVKILF